MNFKKSVLILSAVSVFVAACDKKEILQGRREAISGITSQDAILTSNTKSGRVKLTSPTSVDSYIDVEGNKQHVSENYKGPKQLNILWKTSLGSARINSNLIAFGDNLYVVDSKGVLVCVSKEDGKKVWQKLIAKQPSEAIFSGGLTANNGIIYISTNIGTVVAIDIKTQKELWIKNLKYPLKSLPIYVNGKIIVNSIENQTFALDASTGSVIWTKSSTREDTIMAESGTAAVLGNDVICAYSSGDLKSLESETGADNWEDVLFSTNLSESGSIFSHIAVSPVIVDGNVLAATSESKMVLIDGVSGIRLWEKNIGTLNTPVVNNGWIFVLSSDNQLICMSKTGDIQWAKQVQDIYGDNYPTESNWCGPMLIDGNLVVFSNSGDLLKIDVSHGTLKEKTKIKNAGIAKKPVIINGRMFAITERSDIYAIG